MCRILCVGKLIALGGRFHTWEVASTIALFSQFGLIILCLGPCAVVQPVQRV